MTDLLKCASSSALITLHIAIQHKSHSHTLKTRWTIHIATPPPLKNAQMQVTVPLYSASQRVPHIVTTLKCQVPATAVLSYD